MTQTEKRLRRECEIRLDETMELCKEIDALRQKLKLAEAALRFPPKFRSTPFGEGELRCDYCGRAFSLSQQDRNEHFNSDHHWGNCVFRLAAEALKAIRGEGGQEK